MQSATAAGTVHFGAPKSPTPDAALGAPVDRRTRRPRRSNPKGAPTLREKCGTRRGWLAHQYYHELPCEPCAEAHRDYHREYYRTHCAKRA